MAEAEKNLVGQASLPVETREFFYSRHHLNILVAPLRCIVELLYRKRLPGLSEIRTRRTAHVAETFSLT